MEPQSIKHRYLKLLLVILLLAIIGFAYLVYANSKILSPKSSPSPKLTASATPRASTSPTSVVKPGSAAPCTPDVLSAEETALFAGGSTVTNATYHFIYRMLAEWEPALTNNDQMASFADFPWGDESLAAINFMVIVGEEKVAEYPVGDLVETSSRVVNIDCLNATYKVYQATHNEHWDKDEYHIRTTFAKDGVPYLIILNYPFQGASADGDTIDAYNAILKTIDSE